MVSHVSSGYGPPDDGTRLPLPPEAMRRAREAQDRLARKADEDPEDEEAGD